MKSAPTVLALLIGANAQRREDRDHPKPFFQADEILTVCVDAAGEVEKKKGELTAAEAKRKPLEQALPDLESAVTTALEERNKLVTAVNDYEKVGTDLDTNLTKDDEFDKLELDADTKYSEKLFAYDKAVADEAAAKKAYDDRKAKYDAVVIAYDAAVKSETEEKNHAKDEEAAVAAALTAEQDAIEAYNGSRTDPTDLATGSGGKIDTSKLKLYNTAKGLNDGYKTDWETLQADIATKKAAWDAAVVECTDVTKLYDDQVALVGAKDAVDTNTYKKVKDGNTVVTGSDLTVSITPKNGSAADHDVLGVVLANAEIALAAEISQTNTKLENSTEYKAWKAHAVETVQYYKLFKAALGSDALVNADATWEDSPKTLKAGTTGYDCATSAAVSGGGVDKTKEECKTLCTDTAGPITTADSAYGIDNLTITDADDQCTGIHWDDDDAGAKKCILQKTAVPTKGNTVANDECLKRSSYALGALLKPALDLSKTSGATYTAWNALYTNAADTLADSTQNTNFETKLKAVDAARAAFDKGRQLEWHYKYLKEQTCDEAGTYKKCPDAQPSPQWTFSDAAKENASDCGSGKLCFTQPDVFKCVHRDNGGDGETTTTDSKVHATKDAYDTAKADSGNKESTYTNDIADNGTFGAAKIAMEAAKKAMDEAIAAHTAAEEEKARQDKFVLQVTAAKEKLAQEKSTLDTEVGVSVTTQGLKKAYDDAVKAKGEAETARDNAKGDLDTAVTNGENHHKGADYNTNVTLALEELKTRREAADAQQTKLNDAIKAVADQNGLIAAEDKLIKVAKEAYEAQLALCREEKYDDYKKTLRDAEKDRTDALDKIKKLMADNAAKTPAPGSGKEGARCEKARSNGDGRQRTKCGENLCCGAAKGNVAGAVMTIETCQKTDATEYTYIPPRDPMAIEDKTGVKWTFACIDGAARVAAAATALATSAYLMA